MPLRCALLVTIIVSDDGGNLVMAEWEVTQVPSNVVLVAHWLRFCSGSLSCVFPQPAVIVAL
jgi:hypothetical protein